MENTILFNLFQALVDQTESTHSITIMRTNTSDTFSIELCVN